MYIEKCIEKYIIEILVTIISGLLILSTSHLKYVEKREPVSTDYGKSIGFLENSRKVPQKN